MADVTVTVTLTFPQITKLVDWAATSLQIDDALFERLMAAYVDAEGRVEAAAAEMEEESDG